MKTALYGHVTFLTQDSPPRIATCGGMDRNENNKKECLVYKKGKWQEGIINNLPEKRTYSATARLDVGVFILGGYHTAITSVFLPAGSHSWVSGPRLPVAMSGACAALISSHSFLIVHNKDVYEFDVREDGPISSAGWRGRGWWPQLQVRRKYLGCAVLKKKFIVAGGYNGGSLKSTEIIDLEQRTIHFGSEMQKPRYYFHLLVISGTLHALGGEYYDGSYHYLADVEEFVEDSETWKPANKSLPAARSRYGGVAVNRDLVCG